MHAHTHTHTCMRARMHCSCGIIPVEVQNCISSPSLILLPAQTGLSLTPEVRDA